MSPGAIQMTLLCLLCLGQLCTSWHSSDVWGLSVLLFWGWALISWAILSTIKEPHPGLFRLDFMFQHKVPTSTNTGWNPCLLSHLIDHSATQKCSITQAPNSTVSNKVLIALMSKSPKEMLEHLGQIQRALHSNQSETEVEHERLGAVALQSQTTDYT